MTERNIEASKITQMAVAKQSVEIVERKGRGHPDYIADSLAEEFSKALSKAYLKELGVVAHHNVDKLDIVGGRTTPNFGGGTFNTPILIFFSGRATGNIAEKTFDLKEIAIRSAKEWIRKNLRFLDPDEHVKYQLETKQGAGNLTDLYKRKEGKILGANDTSVGSGYAPFTETEKLVLETEKHMNSKEFKDKHPMSGEDIKVMGLREGNNISLTVANAMVDKYASDIKEYENNKEAILKAIKEFAEQNATKNEVSININTADEPERGRDGSYLTITGTSTEMGDDGAVGRGNRVHGIIPFNRPVSMEAAAGKNPINHVGKIYNILAFQMANRIYEEVEGIEEVYIKLLSQIGKPIDHPKIASAHIIEKGTVDYSKVKSVMDDELARITEITQKVIEGKTNIC